MTGRAKPYVANMNCKRLLKFPRQVGLSSKFDDIVLMDKFEYKKTNGEKSSKHSHHHHHKHHHHHPASRVAMGDSIKKLTYSGTEEIKSLSKKYINQK
jgi:hypothetical protein